MAVQVGLEVEVFLPKRIEAMAGVDATESEDVGGAWTTHQVGTGPGFGRPGGSQWCAVWVGADGGYGHVPEFLWGLVDRELEFLVEVHSNQHVYLMDPRAHPQSPSYEVRDVASVITPKD